MTFEERHAWGLTYRRCHARYGSRLAILNAYRERFGLDADFTQVTADQLAELVSSRRRNHARTH